MTLLRVAALAILLLLGSKTAWAHPAPFTYLDVRILDDVVEVSLVAHVFDLAHDLGVEPPERLLDQTQLNAVADRVVALLGPRIVLAAGLPLPPGVWSSPDALPERQGIRIATRYQLPPDTGTLDITARLFPYDPAHQTFVNVYEGDALTLQALLDAGKPSLEYFMGSRQGIWALARRFVPAGSRHVSLSLDHLLFLAAVLLLGGTRRGLVLLALAFAVGNFTAYVLTVMNLLQPAPRIIEPAIGLSIIYIGADNLMVRGGRDVRAWIALAFGLVHGFWFANGLQMSDLPRSTAAWSLLFFDIGVEAANVVLIGTAGWLMIELHERYQAAAARIATIGSMFVIVAGIYWFVQRVFFPGGFA